MPTRRSVPSVAARSGQEGGRNITLSIYVDRITDKADVLIDIQVGIVLVLPE
jgi:hypothetical protein